MGMEIEVKAYAEDLKAVEAKIMEMGAEPTWEGEQNDTYYNHPQRDFAKTDEALRIRRERGRNSLTYKGPKVDEQSKTREEILFSIENPDAAGNLLVKLGFTEAGRVKKQRKKFELGDLKISLDRVEGLGDFVEIEALNAAISKQDVSKMRDRIIALMDELDLKRRERTSYLELLYPDI
ncbi:MAG: class IV adenylate cyclase [Thermoplasmata archaeon]|nr:MAG: class IV adenylate cyclase [Thermoplasmata archaeon]